MTDWTTLARACTGECFIVSHHVASQREILWGYGWGYGASRDQEAAMNQRLMRQLDQQVQNIE